MKVHSILLNLAMVVGIVLVSSAAFVVNFALGLFVSGSFLLVSSIAVALAINNPKRAKQ